jgi:hypothetical protein
MGHWSVSDFAALSSDRLLLAFARGLRSGKNRTPTNEPILWPEFVAAHTQRLGVPPRADLRDAFDRALAGNTPGFLGHGEGVSVKALPPLAPVAQWLVFARLDRSHRLFKVKKLNRREKRTVEELQKRKEWERQVASPLRALLRELRRLSRLGISLRGAEEVESLATLREHFRATFADLIVTELVKKTYGNGKTQYRWLDRGREARPAELVGEILNRFHRRLAARSRGGPAKIRRRSRGRPPGPRSPFDALAAALKRGAPLADDFARLVGDALLHTVDSFRRTHRKFVGESRPSATAETAPLVGSINRRGADGRDLIVDGVSVTGIAQPLEVSTPLLSAVSKAIFDGKGLCHPAKRLVTIFSIFTPFTSDAAAALRPAVSRGRSTSECSRLRRKFHRRLSVRLQGVRAGIDDRIRTSDDPGLRGMLSLVRLRCQDPPFATLRKKLFPARDEFEAVATTAAERSLIDEIFDLPVVPATGSWPRGSHAPLALARGASSNAIVRMVLELIERILARRSSKIPTLDDLLEETARATGYA